MAETEHSKRFAKVKAFYDKGLWTVKQVRDAVEHGWITEAEFAEITGQPY